jgi:hypothetical protein
VGGLVFDGNEKILMADFGERVALFEWTFLIMTDAGGRAR